MLQMVGVRAMPRFFQRFSLEANYIRINLKLKSNISVTPSWINISPNIQEFNLYKHWPNANMNNIVFMLNWNLDLLSSLCE